MSAEIAVYAILMVVMVAPMVVLHELGHFAVARLCGIHVERFDLGAGPRVFRREGQDGTTYAVCAIPVGAF